MKQPIHRAAGRPDGADAAQREVERRYLDAHSFEEAIDYLAALEELGDANDPDPDEIVRRAFSLAGVVAYARPFSGQDDRHGRREPQAFQELYRGVLNMLPDGQALHEHVKGLRDEYLAHYDAGRAKVERPEGEGPVQYMGPTPLRSGQAKLLRELAGTMATRAFQRARELRGNPG